MDAGNFGQLLKDHPEMLDNSKIFAAFLRDIYPAEKGSVNLLLTTYNAGVVSMLKGSTFDSFLISRIMTLLMDDYSIAEERARWAAKLWIDAYTFSIGQKAEQESQASMPKAFTQSTVSTVSPPPQTNSNDLRRSRKPVSDFFTKIVGVTHNNSGENTENRQAIIQDLLQKGFLNPGQALTLELDVNNQYSENAVKVIAPDGRQIGFLSQSIADNTAPKMRSGYDYQVFVSQVTGGTQGYSYGVNIRIVVYSPAEPVSVAKQNWGQTQLSKPSSTHTSQLPLPVKMQETDRKYFEIAKSAGYCSIWKFIDSNCSTVVVPSEIDGNQVISIGQSAFSGCVDLTDITLPEGITQIACDAFKGCNKLTSINIPDSVIEIGANAFEDCSSLICITIPKSVTKIGTCAFRGCNKLVGITIPDSVTVVGESAFEDCTSLTSITIPKSVTQIRTCTFKGCNELVSITIPDSVTEIGEGAFVDCSSLTNINIPDSVIKIGTNVFWGCNRLTSISIPACVTYIDWAFLSGCSNLKNIVIHSNVTGVEENAFSRCRNLTSITIRKGVTKSHASYALHHEG